MRLDAWLPNAEAMLASVQVFARRFGIDDLRPPERLPNTRRALAIAEHARTVGRLDAFRAAAFDGYWRRGRDLGSPEDLAVLAAEAGLDPAAALAAAGARENLARVDAARRAAEAAGVTGVPTLDLGGLRVVGCQPYAALEAAVRRAGAAPRAAAL